MILVAIIIGISLAVIVLLLIWVECVRIEREELYREIGQYRQKEKHAEEERNKHGKDMAAFLCGECDCFSSFVEEGGAASKCRLYKWLWYPADFTEGRALETIANCEEFYKRLTAEREKRIADEKAKEDEVKKEKETAEKLKRAKSSLPLKYQELYDTTMRFITRPGADGADVFAGIMILFLTAFAAVKSGALKPEDIIEKDEEKK